MFRRILLSLWTLAAAVGAYFLRTRQLSPSFSLNPYGIALWALLGGTVLFAALLVIPERSGWTLSELRPNVPASALQGSGALLITISAAWQLYLLYPSLRSLAAISAAALLLGGLGLFGGLTACCKQDSRAGTLLLLPLCASALQLIMVYQETARDPHLRNYDMHILFLAAAAISMGLLTDFVFTDGKRRLTLVFLSLTVTLAPTLLPAVESLPRLLAVMGTAFTALGYLIALLFGFDHHSTVSYEVVDDPFSTGRVRRPAPAEVAEPAPAEASPAEESVPLPVKKNDDFDLARVDRLLQELENEQDH